METNKITIASALPKSESLNGLRRMKRDIISEPDASIVALVVFKPSKITTDIDSGSKVPTLRVARVEPLLDPDTRESAVSFAMTAYGNRTGEDPLPFEDEDEWIGEAVADDG